VIADCLLGDEHVKIFDGGGELPKAITSYHPPMGQDFSKIFLHLRKFPVISHMRTNFAEMPGNRRAPWEPRTERRFPKLRRRGGESESPEEEAIEIGNSYRNL
jgi:hypothetical protein